MCLICDYISIGGVVVVAEQCWRHSAQHALLTNRGDGLCYIQLAST